MATTSERLREIMSIRNMKQVEIIERTGISKGALSSYISGHYVPKQDNIYKLAEALNVNPAWLMGLDVPMEMPTPKVELDSQIAEAMKMYNEYVKASPEIQGMIESLLKLSQSIPAIPEVPHLKNTELPKPTAELPHLKKDTDK